MTSRNTATMTGLVFLFALASCGGGGGSSSTGGLGQGSYSAASFGYADPYGAAFQPLPDGDFRAARREELTVLGASETRTGYARQYDDAGTSFASLGLFETSLFAKGFVAQACAAGNVDSVPGDELVVIGQSGASLEAVVLAADAIGQWTQLSSFVLAPLQPGVATVAIADMDGDGPEEIVVAFTQQLPLGGWVRVIDDWQAGFATLYHLDVPGCDLVQAVPFDADGDHQREVLVFSREPQRKLVCLVERGASGFRIRGDWTEIFSGTRRIAAGRLVKTAYTRGDSFVALTLKPITGQGNRFYGTIHYWKDGKLTGGQNVQLDWDAYPPVEVLEAVAVDIDGDHLDEIAVVQKYGTPGKYRASVCIAADSFRRNPTRLRLMDLGCDWGPMRLAAFDADADGLEELALTYGPPSQNLRTSVMGWPTVDASGFRVAKTLLSTSHVCPAGTLSLAMAAGDFDRENLVLRSTGRKWLDLPDPMPIVVMAAPPTKTGVGQNYGASVTAYGTEQSIENSHSVATGWTASVSVGFEVSDVLGLFGASVKQTLSAEMERSLTHSQKVTWTKTYTGSHDKDVIVFQGTLYQIYEYEIVTAAKPELIGARITLNDPVATKTFKWTLDTYNQIAPQPVRIGEDVITHVIGDPTSYRRKSAAAQLLQRRYGWMDQSGLQVGEGSGSNATSVTITESNSTSDSRRFGVSWESEVKVGGPTIGGSFGLSASEIYSVTLETGTKYEGTVGDIQNSTEWAAWLYSFGLLVYRHGADAKGKPEPGQRPFQVVSYWVDPLGAGYANR